MVRVPQCKRYVLYSGVRSPEFPKFDYIDPRCTWKCLKRASAGVKLRLASLSKGDTVAGKPNKGGKGGSVVFVATEEENWPLVKNIAKKCGSSYVTDYWIGGTLTNWGHTKERIRSYREHKSLKLSKKSSRKAMRSFYRERRRLAKGITGLVGTQKAPRVAIIVDPAKERGAVAEAKRVGILTVAIGDLNVNPDCVDYFIPGNPEVGISVNFLLEMLTRSSGLQTEDRSGKEPNRTA
jgi:small subunit ribosomal protein S2